TGAAEFDNCTLTGNGASDGANGLYVGAGGGIRVAPGGSLVLRSSIVSGNFNTKAPDVYGPGIASFSALGSFAGITSFTDGGGNLPAGTNLKLSSLGDNGGLTQTVALLAGSPCVNAGSNPASLATDQRGTGFARVVGTAADIGAFEVQTVPPG